ncbi:hypothetical protein jhhlp_003325, partial [Lomentospora prolificans]
AFKPHHPLVRQEPSLIAQQQQQRHSKKKSTKEKKKRDTAEPEAPTMADPADDSLTEDIWASPTATKPTQSQPSASDRPRTPKTPTRPASPTYDHEAALRKELEGVKNVNRAIEGIIGTLERAKGNMNTVSGTVSNASALLNTWTRILSQTEHNQRLVLNPNWKGSTQDILDIEAEAIQKQQAAERRAAEEERRREEAKRRAEEEERKRQAGTATAPRATRGLRSRGRGVGLGSARGTSSSSGSQLQRSLSGAGTSRGTSGIARGRGSVRGVGRSRGVR